MSKEQKENIIEKQIPVTIAVPQKIREHLLFVREKIVKLQIEHDTVLQTLLNFNECNIPYMAFKFSDQTMTELVQVKFPEEQNK